MANVKLPQEIINMLGQMEADALLEGLNDPDTRKNPAFLGKVRQFLKDNNFVTTTETKGVTKIIQDMDNIPDLIGDEVIRH